LPFGAVIELMRPLLQLSVMLRPEVWLMVFRVLPRLI